MSTLNRFLGGNPSSVLLRLVVMSLFVGGMMTVFGWTPRGIFHSFVDFLRGIWNLGFGAFSQIGEFLVVGAMVVVPVFLVLRLLNWKK